MKKYYIAKLFGLQMLLESQNHLEVRVRFLETERANLQRLVGLLWRTGLESNPSLGSAVPSALLKYLPGHSSSQVSYKQWLS